MMTVGQLAKSTGLEAKTLRYYDRVGLLKPARRSPSGYRLFEPNAASRLQFILRAKALGMSLADIRRILAVRDEGAAPCRHVLDLVAEGLDDVESQITALTRLRSDLRHVFTDLKRHIRPDAKAAEDCQCLEIIASFKKG
ncbi:MAG: heavy metal-responsive transcriptional regulator [bacterium]